MAGKSEYTLTIKPELDMDYFRRQAEQASSYKFISDENKKAWAEMLEQVNAYRAEMDMLKKALQDIEGINTDVANAQREEWLNALAEIEDEYNKFIGNVQEETEEVQTTFKDIFGGAVADRRKSIQELQTDFSNKMLDKVDGFGNKLVSTVTKFFSDIYQLATEMMDEMAKYSEHSIEYSQEATNLRMQYGLTGAEAYAFQMAAEKSGFGDFEGYLENAAFATKETLDDFDDMYELALKSYEQDHEIAVAYQKFKDDFEDFKTEAGMYLIDFFMQNKDKIMMAMELGVNLLEGILNAMAFLVDKFGGGRYRTDSERASAISDIYNTYGANKSTNIKIDNTFNNVTPSQHKQFEDAGAMTYKQIIAALK